ncbi:unnamed protein product, partial [Closterium sp. Naga37s-1]
RRPALPHRTCPDVRCRQHPAAHPADTANLHIFATAPACLHPMLAILPPSHATPH